MLALTMKPVCLQQTPLAVWGMGAPNMQLWVLRTGIRYRALHNGFGIRLPPCGYPHKVVLCALPSVLPYHMKNLRCNQLIPGSGGDLVSLLSVYSQPTCVFGDASQPWGCRPARLLMNNEYVMHPA